MQMTSGFENFSTDDQKPLGYILREVDEQSDFRSKCHTYERYLLVDMTRYSLRLSITSMARCYTLSIMARETVTCMYN